MGADGRKNKGAASTFPVPCYICPTVVTAPRAAEKAVCERSAAQNGAIHVMAAGEPKVRQVRLCSEELDGSSGERTPAPDFYANVGSVKRILMRDYPLLFDKPPDMSIYTENIILRDRNHYKLQGKELYQSFFWVVRFHAHLFFSMIKMEVSSIYYHEHVQEIHVRWRVSGAPRMSSIAPGDLSCW
eukprot:CAMPEP_0198722524 /NCGR_PEP_ID=MMETSP1475-20131203/230_1 /TAXON_ID= ORGANISM="Unidentified sp., Strain CCMP1999" /NCGR_SAMPLE_ID=MMETSP1475 /ASSEMBLY_ACC=CAM_ASM_001111 /LENGTH=185 /DNA_ID=CAMNT_0044483435 /DNA_START=51 /DNA_END=605 /DNA_ORIENTATION=+